MLGFYLPIYILSFYLVLSGQHFVGVWVGLELNLFIFLALAKGGAENLLEVGLMKYFLAQAFGSLLLLIGFLRFAEALFRQVILTLRLAVKLGVFPFHA